MSLHRSWPLDEPSGGNPSQGMGIYLPMTEELGILSEAGALAKPEEAADSREPVGERADIDGRAATDGAEDMCLIKQPLAHHNTNRYPEGSWDGRWTI